MNKTELTEKQKAAVEAAEVLGSVAGVSAHESYLAIMAVTDLLNQPDFRAALEEFCVALAGVFDNAQDTTPKKTKTRSQKQYGLRVKKEKWRHE